MAICAFAPADRPGSLAGLDLIFAWGGLMRLTATVALFCFAAGCATTENYEKILRSWVGAEELALVRKWGPPQNVYENGGVRFLTYERSAQGYVPGTAPTYQTTRIGNTYTTQAVGGSPGYAYSQRCTTTFEVSSGRIVSWRWEGNACRARDE